MVDLPLNALRAFAVVYAEGGVRAGARRLGIAHSSVSRHLAELDGWLGRRLVQEKAGRRGLILSAQGEALGRALVLGFGEIERVAQALRDGRAANSVVLSTSPSVAARWLLPRMAAFEAERPRIELSVHVDQRLEDLRSGDVDLGLRIGKGDWPELRCEPLMDDELYPVMSPEYWNKAGRPKKLEQLANLRLLHDRDPNASWELWRRERGPETLATRKGPTFASSDLVLRAAVLGQGVALARHRLARADVESNVLARPFGDVSVKLGTSYWIVLPKHAQVRPAAMTVMAWLKAQARE